VTNDFWRERNVFVTGCSGLLGSWLVKSLIEHGAYVIGLIRDFVPKSNLFLSGVDKQSVLVQGSIEDYPLLERTLNEYEIDTVFHLAAQTIVTIANRGPLSTFKSNIEGTWNILEACRKASCFSGLIVASSDKAYGGHDVLPYDEATPLRGRHPYDVSKSCADLLSQAYFETYRLPVCITRCGNLYGGGDLNFNRIVPGTIRAVLHNQLPIIRSDGSLIRDYFYVKDGVESYLSLAKGMDNKKIHGEAFNFSTEEPNTVLTIVRKILDLMNSDLAPVIQNRYSGEILKQYLSAKKARTVLNWESRYTLDEGLTETIGWYERFFK
jgi:CDP-glucose 4,6-dehydratase